jgi:putative inorganic carbon (HCO3(-)) transporter
MRLFIYIGLFAAVLPFVLTRPFFGLCVYYVVSFLDPKVLCWQPDLQDAFVIGSLLVIGAIAIGARYPQSKKILNDSNQLVDVHWTSRRGPLIQFAWPVCVLILLVTYIAVARLFVPYPLANSSVQFRTLCKASLVVLLLTGLASDVRRFRILYLVVALSVGFWTLKGGLKFILLGSHQLYGRTYDNNLFALTSVMVLPMIFYFGQSLRHRRWRFAFMVASGLACLAVVGAHSRAGFLALVVVLACMAWSSRYRVRSFIAVGVVACVTLAISSADISQRVAAIINYEQDQSSTARFFTWGVARDLFLEHPLIGIGISNYELAKQERMGDRKAAHNIYLQNAAELGILGHSLWLLMLFGTMFSAYRFMRRSRRLPEELRWAYYWSRGLLLGLLAFSIHGFFHNEDFLELMLTMIGMNVALQTALRRELEHRKLSHLVAEPKTAARVTELQPAIHPGKLFTRRRLQGA